MIKGSKRYTLKCEAAKNYLAVAKHPTQQPTQHGRGPGPGGQAAARANQNPPYAPASGPAPRLPAPFRISANLSTLGSPRAWAATGWAGLTVLRGAPPLSGWQRAAVFPPPNSRQKYLAATQPWGGCSGLGCTASTPSSSPQSRLRPPPRSPGSPGGRPQPCSPSDNGAAPTGRWKQGDGPRPYCLHARIQD